METIKDASLDNDNIIVVHSDDPKSHIGNFYPLLKRYSSSHDNSLSFLTHEWTDVEVWRSKAREKMQELLAYAPQSVPLEPNIRETVQKNGYKRLLVRYTVASGCETEAYLLIPDNLHAPAPAVIALHDHGGFYYYGKEKITETENDSMILKEHIATAYERRPFADELVRHGFVVLIPDAFYFGSQRLRAEDIPLRLAPGLSGLKPGSDDYIHAYNQFAGIHEALTAKSIFVSGSTWPGIMFQGDRACIDYLMTRPEIDPNRIGCIGLSIGGFRSVHLFGLDSRIKAAVVVGWMTTYSELLFDHLEWHTWMIYVPRQQTCLDLPDILTLNTPNPVLVINCSRDELFTMEGMKQAEAKIREVYRRFNAVEKFKCIYCDEPHSFKVSAQDKAIEWLNRWLKQGDE